MIYDENAFISFQFVLHLEKKRMITMENRWSIVFRKTPIGYLCAILYLDYNEVASYIYDDLSVSAKEKAVECTKHFVRELKKHDYTMQKDKVINMAKLVLGNFLEHKNNAKKSQNSYVEQANRDHIVLKVSDNACYFSKYVVDTCIEKVLKGASKLVPGVDRVPKNISFIDTEGKKYYAKISDIEILNEVTQKTLEDAFPSYEENIIVAFEIPEKRVTIAFSLGYIGNSDDERTLQFYKPTKIQEYEAGETAIVCNISECENFYYTNSPLLNRLKPIIDYYNERLDEVNQKAESIRVQLNLNLLRTFFNEFKEMAVDENMIIVPVIGKTIKINGISVLTKNYDNKTTKYDFYDGNLNAIAKENKESYLETLSEIGIELPENSDLAVLNLVNLSDKDVFLLRRILTDSENKSCVITNNVEGDKVRLGRIISGIENALTGSVANKRLVELICNNDINVSLGSDSISSYIPDNIYIEYLKNEYPILKNNNEQLIAIDKILKMDKNDIDVMLVQGPPGTGKTELILALAKELSKAKYNTLITSNVHVACDNIVDRLKNNKELVLKRYTSIYGEQYEREIIENKKKYVENQVLEGFKFKDFIVDSFESYERIKETITQEKERRQQILDSKEKYDNDLKDYHELVLQQKNLETELSENESELSIVLQDVAKLKNIINIHEDKISQNNEKIDVDSSTLEALKNKQSEENATISELTDQLNALYSRLAALEDDSKLTRKNIQNAENSVVSLQGKNEAHKSYSDFLASITEDEVKNKVLSHVMNGEMLESSYYEILLNSSLIKARGVLEIYTTLRKDADFWNKGSNISLTTLEYILFKNKKDGALKEFLNQELLDKVDEVYEYCKTSNLKHNVMSIMPFVKLNGHNKAYYEKCLSQITLELKKIQYNYSEFIFAYISKEASKEAIDSKSTLNNQKIKDINKTLKELNEECISQKEKLDKLGIEILEQKEKIKTTNNSLASAKSSFDNVVEQISSINNEISNLKDENTNSIKICSKSNVSLEEQMEVVAKLNDKQNNLKALIESARLKTQRVYNLKQVIIEEYNTFINKMNIDLNTIEKKINIYSQTLGTIDNKIQHLVSNGWDEQEAKEFIFDYTEELQNIVACTSEKVEECFFNGKGNEFNKMFLLSEKSDGSLISMTTNQIASLLTSADNRNFIFDYAIIDEASKCSFEDLIISLPRIKHLILIGDFMQLDPMYEKYTNIDLIYQNMFSVDEWDAINKSSFSLLLSQFVKHNEKNNIADFETNPYVAVMKRQYRMNKGIFSLIEPVYSIHKGFDLIDEKQTSANDVKCININGTEIALETSQYNIEEADAIVSFLVEFQANRQNFPNIKTIGIITGYRAQENYLRRKLKSIKIKGVQIGTFDRFQGREYDLVIVSLVRTRKLGFTNNVRRMNVAFSRAKNHLLVFGNFEALNKIAAKTTIKDDEDFSNSDNNENLFVVKSLIPRLYSLRESFVSNEECAKGVLDFIKENDYER